MNIDKTIYHIFRADVHFMTTSMIEDIILTSEVNHFFIIVGINDENKSYFLNLFAKYKEVNHLFLYEKSSLPKTRFISNLFKRFFKISFLNWEIDLLCYLSKLKHPTILIHAECSVMFSLLLSFKNTINKNLVIWGSVPNTSNYSVLYSKLRRYLYHCYSNIVCLMPEDCDRFIKYYNYKNSIFIPYINRSPAIVKNIKIDKKESSSTLRILLGNSGQCINYYYDDLKTLSIFKNENISIDCMLNYGSSKADNDNLEKVATLIYGANFRAHTTLWTIDQYYDFMNRFDLYVSSRKDQSGLGAIYTALLLGMKVFLAGNNFMYLNNIGTKIYHTDQISNMSFHELSTPLTNQEKALNYSIIDTLLDYKNVSIKWDNFYNKITVMES